MKRLKEFKLNYFFLALITLFGTSLEAPLFESSLFGDSTSYIKSWVESATGFKSLAEGTRAFEQVLSRDIQSWRFDQIQAIDRLRTETIAKKAEILKKLENPRKYLEEELARHSYSESGLSEFAELDRNTQNLMDLYDERLQIINSMQSALSNLVSVVDAQLAFLRSHSDEIIFEGADLASKVIYKISEYNYIDNKIEVVDGLIREAEKARAKVESERSSRQNAVNALRKESAAKERELRSVKNDVRNDLVEAEDNLLRDKVFLEELRVQESLFEKSKVEDEITILKFQKSRFVELLARARRNLAIDSDDIARAKRDSQDSTTMSERARTELKNRKDSERDRIRQAHEATRVRLSSVRALGREGTAEGLKVQAQEACEKSAYDDLTTQIALLDLEANFSAAEAAAKLFNYKSVDIRFKLSSEDAKIEGWIDELSNQKRILEGEAAVVQRKRNDGPGFILRAQEELDRLERRLLDLAGLESTIFSGDDEKYREVEKCLKDAIAHVKSQINKTQEFDVRAVELERVYSRMLRKHITLLGELEAQRVSLDIWRRSNRGLSLALLTKAVDEIQVFAHDAIAKAYGVLDIIHAVRNTSGMVFLGFLIALALGIVGYFGTRFFLVFLRRRLQLFISYQKGTFVFWYLNVVLLLIDALLRHYFVLYPLIFVTFHLKIGVDYFGLFTALFSGFGLIVSCATTMGILIYVATDFISELRVLNARLSYFFFSERSQKRILLLLNILLYSSAIAIPLRASLLVLGSTYEALPTLVFALYSLAVTIVLAFFFEKDDFTNLVSGRSPMFIWLREAIDTYFYPVFAFALALCLMANPYVGYVRLAWYLAAFVPGSLATIWIATKLYGMMRNQVLWIFIEERDDELAERFEHAKVYYGFLITMTFFGLVFLMIGGLSYFWGLRYDFAYLWMCLTEEWVIHLDPGVRVGCIEILTLYSFLTGGYFASTCINKFVLAKVFEVFGTEAGAQNTFLRIFHVLTLIVSVMLGCIAIGLVKAVLWMLLAIGLAGFFGAKDLVADFVAGLLILLERQIEIGHYITAEGMRGTVHRISARSTIIRTQQNYFVVIPNRTLISHSIVNWGAGRFSVGFELSLSVGYENDPEMIIAILRKILNAHALVLRVPAPTVRLENFSQNAADYFVRAFVSIRKVREQWEVASDIRIAVYKAFREKGIVFPYPRLVMYQNNNQPDDAHSFFKVRFDESPDDMQGRGPGGM